MPEQIRIMMSVDHKTGCVAMAARILMVLLVALSIQRSLPAAAEQTGWHTVKSGAGVEILQRDVPNSPYKATRGTLLSNAGVFDVLAVLGDVEACPRWLHKCKLGKMVEEISEGDHIYYTVIDSPFLIKDRDTYVRSVVTYEPESQSLHITMTGAENTAPPADKRVRVLDFRGRWLIEPQTGDQIRLTYEVHMDPQVRTIGAANSTMATSVFETLKNVDRLAQASPYRNSAPPEALNSVTHSRGLPK